MPIPKNITSEDILKALKYIDLNGIPITRESTKYELVFNASHYPPKYVISIANKYANGVEHDPSLFSGGKETNDFLKGLGFEVTRINRQWIFQGNPERFDVNKYLLDNELIYWSIRQEHYKNEIQINDDVYIWRSDGSNKGTGGIIAKCKIVETPQVRQNDKNSNMYWFTDDWMNPYLAVQLRVMEVRLDEEDGFISRTTLSTHPILSNIRILKVRQNTNYLLSEEHAVLLEELWGQQDDTLIELNDIDSEIITDTEKIQIVKSRIGQTLFKKRLLSQYKKCCLCNVKDKRFLVASHIKPWNQSSNEERLDGNNGLLLCPNHDSLFDKGLISFDDEGSILISSSVDENTMVFMNVARHMKIEINEKKLRYIRWHREHLYYDNGNK